MKTNIALIGFMGTGKTAVGKRLAALLKKKFYDTDQEIERVTGLTVTQIFKRYGEVRFRSEENLAISRVAARENCVIATGGGAVLDKRNVELLARNAVIICLYAQPKIVYERVKKRNNRPLLQKGDLYQTIVEMMAEREAYYKCAELSIDTSNLDFQEIIDRIMAFLNQYKMRKEEYNAE